MTEPVKQWSEEEFNAAIRELDERIDGNQPSIISYKGNGYDYHTVLLQCELTSALSTTTRLQAELAEARKLVKNRYVHMSYDCPGDTVVECGLWCDLCRQHVDDGVHAAKCFLSPILPTDPSKPEGEGEKNHPKNQPLVCVIEDEQLVIRIGVSVLAFACQQREPFHAYDEKIGDWRNFWDITNPNEFAKEIKAELLREEEDGSSPLTNLLDKAAEEALDQGSLAVKESRNG